MKMLQPLLCTLAIALASSTALADQIVNVGPSQDNSIFSGNVNNSGGGEIGVLSVAITALRFPRFEASCNLTCRVPYLQE